MSNFGDLRLKLKGGKENFEKENAELKVQV